MAILSKLHRQEVLADFIREGGSFNKITKSDLSAAIAALDDYLATNTATINSNLPKLVRDSLTLGQKSQLLMMVLQQRMQRGS